MLKSVWNEERKEYEVICSECGEVVTTYDAEYASNYPNSCDKWLEELEIRHNSYDCLPEVREEYTETVVCPDCGEVLGECSYEYFLNNPNGYGIWADQLQEQHEPYCKANPDYEEYESETELILEGETTFGRKYKIYKEKCYHITKNEKELYTTYYWVKFEKGEVNSNNKNEILEEWNRSFNEIVEKIPEAKNDLIEIFTYKNELIEKELRKKGLIGRKEEVVYNGDKFVIKELEYEKIIEEYYED